MQERTEMDKLYDRYRTACAEHLPQPGLSFRAFADAVGPALAAMERVTVNEGPDCEGAMYWDLTREGEAQVCAVPVFAWYASSEKALTMLFSRMAERVLAGGTTRFSVRVYAREVQARTLFSMMQFGYVAEKGVCRIDWDSPAAGEMEVRTLTRDEVEARWDDVWSLTSSIIRHLQQPPVFYPGREFTEEVYRASNLDDDTRVHAAFAPDGRMVGVIETNAEPYSLMGEGCRAVNVGEVYVLPEYRGTGLARRLLVHAGAYERARGADSLWVEHGTANPNARRFWGKYFSPCEYELERVIAPVNECDDSKGK